MRQRIAIAALCMAATQVSASTVVRYDGQEAPLVRGIDANFVSRSGVRYRVELSNAPSGPVSVRVVVTTQCSVQEKLIGKMFLVVAT